MNNNYRYLIGFCLGVITPLLLLQLFLTYQTVSKGETYVLQSPFVLLDDGKQQEIMEMALNNGVKRK